MTGQKEPHLGGLLAGGVIAAEPMGAWAASGFVDVSPSNVHTEAIQWMGTTDSPPVAGTAADFCQSDPIQRDQFASFVKALAEAQIVDAATVGGKSAEELQGEQGERGPRGRSGDTGPQGEPGDAVLADLTCTTDQIIRWDGDNWACSNDTDTLASLSCVTNESVGWDGDRLGVSKRPHYRDALRDEQPEFLLLRVGPVRGAESERRQRPDL